MVLAVAETVAVLATGLFVYLSFNAITHPGSLLLHITHLLPWPAEGTVRVEALLLCACSIASGGTCGPGTAGYRTRPSRWPARTPWRPEPAGSRGRVHSGTVATEVLPDTGTREDTGTTPDIRPGDGDHERFAHYVEKDKIVDSAVTGTPVIALCGKVWVPNRDPKRFPVCPDCKRIYESLPQGDD